MKNSKLNAKWEKKLTESEEKTIWQNFKLKKMANDDH